jgi:ABC-type transporter Mla MlaB component
MAAGSTYTPIATTTASGSSNSVTFSSIPNTYTDLVIVFNGNSTTAGSSANSLRVTCNGDTATNYSYTYLAGNGTSAASGRASNQTYWDAIDIAQASSTGMAILHFMNYANTTTFKTMISRSSVASVETLTAVNLWRKTPEAITSITLDANRTITSGSTFTLYGLAAA